MRSEHPEYVRLPPPPPATEVAFEEERPRRLGDFLAVVRRHLRLAVTCFGVTFALAVLVTLLTPRSYTAATRIQVGRQSAVQLRLQNNVVSLDDSDRSDRAALTFVSTQAAALRSRDLAERVIRAYGLDRRAAFLEPATHRNDPLPIAQEVPETLRPSGFEVAPGSRPARGASAPQPIDPELLDRYMRYLSVKEVQGADLVDVAFVTPSAPLSAFLSAVHTEAYLEANEDARHATDVFAEQFLAQKLAAARKRVKRSETALARFTARHPSVAADKEEHVGGKRLADLSALLTKSRADRLALESRYQFLTSPRTDPLAYFLDRPAVERLRLSLLDVRAQKAGLDERLGENHPHMLELTRLESEIDEQLRAEVSRDVESVRAKYDAARQQEDRLRAEVEEEQRSGSETNRLAARYELLHNDVDTARKLHGSLLEQQLATHANSDIGASNIRIIERAQIPKHPSWPKVPLNLVFGLTAGLVIGVGAAFTRDYFDHSVRSGTEIEALLNVPMLATIPNFALARASAGLPAPGSTNGTHASNGVGSARGHELVVLHEPESPVSEAFRSMRTALLFTPARRPRVIVLTSARAGEGKTVASLNLATALAQCGARVLLIEADLRHPRLHQVLGMYNRPGLSDYLAGQHDELDDLIRHVDAAGLAFLPSGAPSPNPAELLGSSRMRALLRTCRERYDFVVVDTPPVLPVTDAVVIGRRSDGVVLVVKGSDTPRELVRRAHDRLVQTGIRCLGTIVNNVDGGWGDPYFYDAYSAYRRGVDAGEPAHGDQASVGSMADWLRGVVRRTSS
jgi:capsular exopolysaccharide synthesis family protein